MQPPIARQYAEVAALSGVVDNQTVSKLPSKAQLSYE